MSKLRHYFEISSFGIYDSWDEKSKALPNIKSFTTKIPAQLDIEFGFILNVKKAKGKCLEWAIHHPNIHDKKGRPMEPFEGEVYVRNNDWDFYLGDTIWSPVDDKVGDWHMLIKCDGKVVAEKVFDVAIEHGDGEVQFWKRRGF
ncbi:DUF3859 domain-containing protein [Paraglaciecola sp. 2405UD69-4]|uniref:DUF3859 domain-containing protein n=1 Tax=Paraglaciecola sp. 2405UD69-4 TaxID=3391836 RepID=UPI0039C90F91